MGARGLPDDQDLPTVLRAYRHANRVTQTEFARRLGVTQQTVARWERGLQPRADLLARIYRELQERDEGKTQLAKIFSLADAGDVSLSASEDDDDARLRRRFLNLCLQKAERGEWVPEKVIDFMMDELRSRK